MTYHQTFCCCVIYQLTGVGVLSNNAPKSALHQLEDGVPGVHQGVCPFMLVDGDARSLLYINGLFDSIVWVLVSVVMILPSSQFIRWSSFCSNLLFSFFAVSFWVLINSNNGLGSPLKYGSEYATPSTEMTGSTSCHTPGTSSSCGGEGRRGRSGGTIWQLSPTAKLINDTAATCWMTLWGRLQCAVYRQQVGKKHLSRNT